MTDIYDQHQKAFANVSAYVVTNAKGDPRARIAFKHGNAVTAYVHLLGVQMVKARANGGGYDRQSAAVSYTATKIATAEHRDASPEWLAERRAFTDAIAKDDGSTWLRNLEKAGFTVLQAV